MLYRNMQLRQLRCSYYYSDYIRVILVQWYTEGGVGGGG